MLKIGNLAFTRLMVVLALSAMFFVLPVVSTQVFLSPDETAIAVSSKAFEEQGGLHLAPFDQTLRQFSWLHPRSFVTVIVGDDMSLVPVGFIGMPILVSALRGLFSSNAFLFTPLLALSVILPLLWFTSGWGKLAQSAAVFTWLSFPTVILYANRGLFPNLVVLCLVIWAAWCLWHEERPRAVSLVTAGLLAGWAFAIRPPEALWFLPWLVLAYAERHGWRKPSAAALRHVLIFVAPLILVSVLFSLLAWKTYGQPFIVGYQLRDPTTATVISGVQNQAATVRSIRDAWPFGFHPRNIWHNAVSYLVEYLFPWFAVMLGALFVSWRVKSARPFLLVAAWTIAVLVLVYGNGIYQDHVRLNAVTLANSFLRYLLPISIVAVFAAAWLTRELEHRLARFGQVVAIVVVAGLVSFGFWTAFVRDNEGLLADRIELARYAVIRAKTEDLLPRDTVVISDRSDKIFFPIFNAVSPLPSPDKIRALLNAAPMSKELNVRPSVAIFTRTLSSMQEARWRSDGISLRPLFTSGNESLYLAYQIR